MRITESENNKTKFGNKERHVLRQPKCKAEREKKYSPYQKNDISLDRKKKQNCGERQQEKGTRAKGK